MIRSIDLCIWDKSVDDWEQKCLEDPYMGSNTCFVVTPGGQLLINTNMSGLYKLGTCGLERTGKLILRSSNIMFEVYNILQFENPS